jgi:glycosyltransferase involved in cell wall biosynthesis
LRLVLTVERYYPAIGGAERVVQRISEGLAHRGHDVLVVTSGERSSEAVEGVHIERFPITGNLARGIKGDVADALRTIEASKPDLVMSYAAQTWTTDACMRFLAERDFQLVLAPCGFSALADPRYLPYFKQMRELLPQYDALIFHSAIYQDWAFAQAAGADNSHVIPNAADDPAPLERTHSGGHRIVTVGSHVRSKGHTDFFGAIAELRHRSLEVEGLLLAPPRRGLDALRGCQARCMLQAALPGSHVGLVDGRELTSVPRALAQADLFLFPSRIECAPLVILEAMAAAVPWVSYDVGNVRELPGGVVTDGFDGLVNSALTVLADGGNELGIAGRAAWEARHRWPDVIAEYERLFTRLIGGPSRPPSLARPERGS